MINKQQSSTLKGAGHYNDGSIDLQGTNQPCKADTKGGRNSVKSSFRIANIHKISNNDLLA